MTDNSHMPMWRNVTNTPHQPRVGDKFWDGQRYPKQANGKIVYVDYEERCVVVEFYDTELTRVDYLFTDIKAYYIPARRIYILNESDWLEGWHRDNTVSVEGQLIPST